jgi:hypothetical protein
VTANILTALAIFAIWTLVTWFWMTCIHERRSALLRTRPWHHPEWWRNPDE